MGIMDAKCNHARLEDLLLKPVDIIVAKDKNREIEKEAMRGILL